MRDSRRELDDNEVLVLSKVFNFNTFLIDNFKLF